MEVEGSPSGSGAGDSSGPLRGSIVSSACQSCKKKKAKCDGGPPPCTPCRKRQTQCVFAPELDQRRRLAKRTRVEEAQFTQRLAEGLILKIRNSNDGELAALIDTIRGGASVKEIASYIHRNGDDPGTSTPESSEASLPAQKSRHRAHASEKVSGEISRLNWSTGDLQKSRQHTAATENGTSTSQGESQGMSNRRRRLISIGELVDANPLVDVPARPWTTQTVSDNLFSHMISLFLTWRAPYWSILLEDALISALKSRDLRHPLCSPFLVNAILAVSSQLSDPPAVRARVDEPMWRGENFHDEALSLWVKEQARPSLTNMQALFILCNDSRMRGREDVAQTLLEQLCAMHKDLGLSHQLPSLARETNDIEQVEQSFRLVAWATYNCAVETALIAQKRNILSAPTFGLPFSDQQAKAIRHWCAYPRRDSIAIPQNAVINAKCDLAVRCAKIIELLYRKDGTRETSPRISTMRELLNDLEQWRGGLPESLQPGHVNSPIVTELHGTFYASVLSAQQLLAASDRDGGANSPPHQAQSSQQDGFLAHVRAMMPILTNHRDTYGYSTTPYGMIQAVEISSAGLVPHLKGAHSTPCQQAFTEICACLVVVGRRYGACKDDVRRLQQRVKRAGIELPLDV